MRRKKGKRTTKHKFPLLRHSITLLVLLGLLFGINSYNRQISEEQLQNILLPKPIRLGFPVRLKIPKINVDAAIKFVGVNSQNAMEVPSNTADVGWLKIGPKPGEKGSAVIDGHVDTENGEEGVFANLYKLAKGDILTVENDQGKAVTFVVVATRIYDEDVYAPEVFGQGNGIHLNLITCDGIWDGAKRTYTKRLVIFSDVAS